MSDEGDSTDCQRYEPVEVLLSEAGVHTTLCADGKTGALTVVKTVDGGLLPASAWAEIERDISASRATDLRMPPTKGRYDPNSGTFRTVAPFVEGTTLARRLTEDGPLDLSEALAMAQRIADALAGDHGRGTLHCGVSPSNIVLPGSGRGAVLIDVGLARRPTSAGAFRDRMATRWAYLAPELAGLLERGIDQRADLYSLGTVIFEALTGTTPFPTEFSHDLRHQVSTEPPSLRDRGLAVPRAVDRLVRRLLAKEPLERGDTAAAVRDELLAIARALNHGIHEPASPEMLNGALVGRPSFIGRTAELAELDRALRDAERGLGGFTVVEGESGVGKSRLVETFADRAAAAGAWIVRGEAHGSSAPQPLQLLSGVIDDVASAMLRSPDLALKIRSSMGREAALLADAIPALEATFGAEAERPPLAPPATQKQIVHALASLIRVLGGPQRPTIVVLEDCQWGDEVSLQVTEELLRSPGPGRHVMVIATVRTEHLGPGHFLQDPHVARVALAPLSSTQVTGLLQSMITHLPEDAVDVITSHARGNPFMASALLLGLIESGALDRANGRWEFRSGRVPIQVSRGSTAFLAGRLDRLPHNTRDLLSVAAVVGRTFDIALVATIARVPAEAAGAGLRDAERRHLVWRTGDGRIAFAHDRLRETLLSELTAARRQELHLRAARAIEALDATRAFELSFHYNAAGRDVDAFEHARSAARIARARYDLELAAHHLRVAEASVDADGHAEDGFAIAEELGEILTLRGEYDAADERLVRARAVAPDPIASARIEGRLGELEFKRGRGRHAETHLVAALELLGHTIPGADARYGARLLLEQLHRASRRLVTRIVAPKIVEDERRSLEVQLLTRLAYAWWFNRRTFAAMWLLTRQVNVAEMKTSGSTRAHAQAIYGAAITAVFPFLSRRGLRYTGEARKLHAAANSRWGEGQALAMEAAVLHASSRFEDSLAAATAAREILEETGDQWELAFATWHQALCLYRLGRLDEAVDIAGVVHRMGVELGAPQAEAIGLEILAKARVGSVNPEAINESVDHAGTDAHAVASASQAKSRRLRRSGHLSEALSVLEGCDTTIRPPAFMNVYLAPVATWLATLHREAIEERLPAHAGQRRRDLRRAGRVARRAVRLSRLYRTEMPRAYREAALLAALSGSPRRARRLIDRSAAVALGQGARLELALTHHAAERLRLPTPPGLDGLSAVDLETAAALLDAEAADRRQPTLGFMDRFDAILEAGSLLAAAVSTADIVDAVDQACRHLLRAERCAVVGIHQGLDEVVDEVEGASFPAANELVHRALHSRRPVCVTAVPHDMTTSDRGAERQVRSALCAPIMTNGEAVGCFIAVMTQVDDFFGSEDERLAGFISRLAGAALTREKLRRELRWGIVAAQESERARIARDLHDELGQSLTSVLLGLRAAQTSVQAGRVERDLGEQLAGLRSDAGDALTAVERLAFELRPLVLDDLGLIAALRRLVATVKEKHGLVIELASDLDDADRLPRDVETTAYRVSQEALTNVVRHARADTVSVVLSVRPDRVRVVIEDDGAGFDAKAACDSGFGMSSMRERAVLVGGTVQVTSDLGAGTTVVLEIPVA